MTVGKLPPIRTRIVIDASGHYGEARGNLRANWPSYAGADVCIIVPDSLLDGSGRYAETRSFEHVLGDVADLLRESLSVTFESASAAIAKQWKDRLLLLWCGPGIADYVETASENADWTRPVQPAEPGGDYRAARAQLTTPTQPETP